MQLEKPALEGPTKIASRNDKPEDVLTDGGFENCLGCEGGKGEKAAVTCAWLQAGTQIVPKTPYLNR